MENMESLARKEADAATALMEISIQGTQVENDVKASQTLLSQVETAVGQACNTQTKDAIYIKREPDLIEETAYDPYIKKADVNGVIGEDEAIACSKKIKKEASANELTTCSQTDTNLTQVKINPVTSAVAHEHRKMENVVVVDTNRTNETDSECNSGECSESESDYDSGDDNDHDSDDDFDTESHSDIDGGLEDTQDESIRAKKSKNTASLKPKSSQGLRARTAREYIARLHEKEDAARVKQAENVRKRKAGAARYGSTKRAKVTIGSAGPDVITKLGQDMIGNSQHAGLLASAMPEITASTHRKQFTMLNSSIPAGADTRRTRTQKRDLREAARLFGYKRVKAMSGRWLLDGLESGLYNHQLTAAAWMVKRECARAGPLGGLIADEMGMGKTLTSLACVVGNPPDNADLNIYVNCTLVIVPNVDIADQWYSEIQQHCSQSVTHNTMVYRRAGWKEPFSKCQKQMVIITTIKEVQVYCRRLPKPNPDSEEILAFNWYRIILDEAHSIKNMNSLTKKCVCTLKAKHRWALTGTPLSNSAEEFVPYLQFIGCNIDEGKRSFRKEYMNNNKANKKFETLISMVMYRRTNRDTFLGHTILNIPPSETHDIWVPLSREEEIIYKFVKGFCLANNLNLNVTLEAEDEQQGNDKSTKAQDESGKKNASWRKQNIYMRRLISHPYNIERLLRLVEDPSQIQELRNDLLEQQSSESVLEQILADETGLSNLEKYKSGLTQIRKYTSDAFGGTLRFCDHLQAIQNEVLAQISQCPKCGQRSPKDPLVVKECGHIYCSICYWSMVQPRRFSLKDKSLVQTCRVDGCTQSLESVDPLLTMSVIFDQASADKHYDPPDVDNNKVTLPRANDQMGCFVASSYQPLSDLSMIPNSRLTTAMTVLLSWRIDFPEDKIIVFTENVMTAKILGSMLNHACIGFVYYYGCMGNKKKSKALETFREDANTKVFLAGLRSGGQSLNITCANRVIIIDPWWNVTSELQAAGRTNRIGQKKNCWVVRIFTSAATDERVAQLQRNKSEQIDHALQDDGHVPQVLDDEERHELFTVTEEESHV